MAEVNASHPKELTAFFRGRRVLITGDTGFKGSWLAHWLLKLGANITGISLAPTSSDSHYVMSDLAKRYQSHRVDIRDATAVKAVFQSFQPEIVLHLAAQALVRSSYADPHDTYSTNVMGSLNVMDAVRATPSVRSFVNVTSDKCYKNKEWVWGYRETDELGGYDPYSSSKACAEVLFESYRQSFFQNIPTLGVTSVRAGNVIGGGDYAEDRIIPDIVRALTAKKSPLLRSPNSTRPWQHVLEPLGGYLLVAMNAFHDPKRFSGAWNFGPNGEAVMSVEHLTKHFVKTWGSGSYEVAKEKPALHEARLLHLSIDKAKADLHWNPVWNFADTVQQTADWYLRVARGEAAATVTSQQIDTYMEAWS